MKTICSSARICMTSCGRMSGRRDSCFDRVREEPPIFELRLTWSISLIAANDRHGVRVVADVAGTQDFRRFDPVLGTLRIDSLQTFETRQFQVAYQFARLAFAETIERISEGLGPARDLLATGLAN